MYENIFDKYGLTFNNKKSQDPFTKIITIN